MELSRKAIRVGLSASLCILVSNLLKLKFPFFVLLPAVMPISTFFGETVKFGINRMVGSTIGAIIGVLLVYIQLQSVLLVGLGVIIIMYICNYLKWDSTTSIACLVFCSIIVGVKGPSAINYSAHRLLDTFIGIAITTIVNNNVFNPDMKNLFNKQAKTIEEKLLNIANNKDFFQNENELDKIELQLNTMKAQLKVYSEEIGHKEKHKVIRSKLDNLINTLLLAFQQIKIISYINSKKENYKDSATNNIEDIISFHKEIFFNEITNLNKVMNDIT